MVLAYRVIVAIVQLIIFVPSFCFGILLATRHGFKKSGGWYFLIMFSLLRTVGAICEIIAMQTGSISAYIAALICGSIGLAPLTLLCVGLLGRVNTNIKEPLTSKIFRFIELASLVGLILGIVGGNLQDHTTSGLVSVVPEIKAAIIIFLLVFLSTIFILGYLCMRMSMVPSGERRILVAVALCIPFIAVRLVYALIADFASLQSFSSINGDNTIYLCMNVIMELITTIIVIVFGMTLRVLPKEVVADENELVNTTQSGSKPTTAELNTARRERERRKIHGPITWLYYNVKSLFRSN